MKKTIKRTTKILSMILCIVMMLGMFPATALADGIDAPLNDDTGTGWTDFGGSIEDTMDSGGTGNVEVLPPPMEPAPERPPVESLEPDNGVIQGEDLPNVDDNGSSGTEQAQSEPENPAPPALAESAEHWIQQYQDWALTQTGKQLLRASSGTPSFTMITWGNDQEADRIWFANGTYINSPLPKIMMNGDIAICGQWNGINPVGTYTQVGQGSDSAIKQYLANFDNSGKTNGDYVALQALVWARIMGTTVTSWGSSPGGMSANAIMNGTNDFSSIKYQYLHWTGGSQDLITFNNEDIPDIPLTPNDDEYVIRINKKVLGTNAPLAGATFEVRSASHGVIGTMVSKSNGVAEMTVPYPGTYIITELAAPNGFKISADPDCELYVDDDAPEAAATMFNAPYTGIRVTKTDAVTGAVLSGATIKLHQISTGVEFTKVTNSSGVAEFNDMEPGSYYVEEVIAPENYVLNSTRYPVELRSNETATVTIPNNPYTGIEVTKVDANTGQKLAGAYIKIKHIASGQEYSKTTGADGIAYFGLIPPGDYYVEEVQAPFGYILNTTRFPLELRTGELAALTLPNYRKDGLFIKKVDPNGKPIAGAVFELRRGSGAVLMRETTDQNGVIYRGNLTTDTYVVEEIQAPPGFILDPHNPQSIYIDSTDDNKEYVLTFVNQKKPAIEITKIDADAPGKKLSGASFRISEQGGSKYWDITTGTDGKALLENLEPDIAYLVEEIQPPTGYSNSGYRETVVLEVGKIHTITVANKALPALNILKKDKVSGKVLFGATFRVAWNNGADYRDVTTNVYGEAKITGLDAGWYTITETKPPQGYLLDSTPHQILIEAGKDAFIELYNEQKPSLKLKKVDSVTRSPLANAEFSITMKTASGDKLIGKFVTDANGEILLDTIEPGRYVITETKAPDGFNIDTATHEITIEFGQAYELTLTNTAKSPIYIQKVDGNGSPLAGAKIKVTTMNGAMVGTVTTGRTGYAIIPYAEPGWYVAEEIQAPDGFILSSTPINIEVKSGRPAQVEFVNYQKPYLQILKLDADTQKALGGARFKVTTAGGAFTGEYTTDVNGLIMLENLDPGVYVITEIRSPDGYLLDMTPQTITLAPGKPQRVEFYDSAKPGLQVLKLDKVTGLPVAGAMFSVTYLDKGSKKDLGAFTTSDAGTFFIPDLQPGNYVLSEVKAAPNYILDSTPKNIYIEGGKLNTVEFYNMPYSDFRLVKIDAETRVPLKDAVFKLFDEKRLEIGTYTTTELGEIYVKGLPSGNYFIQEIKAPPGFVLDNTVRAIELFPGKTTTVEIKNTPLGSIRVKKVDSVTGKPIYGVGFLFYDASDNLLGEYTTDQNGLISFSRNLKAGKYKLKEIKAHPDYVLDETVHTITVKEGATTEIEIKNTPKTGKIQITKKAADDNPLTRDKAGKTLADAVFEICNSKLEVVDTITTDSRGVATSKELPPGIYAVREIEAPRHYTLDGKVFYAEIKLHGDIIKFDVLNYSPDISVSVEKRGNVEVQAGQDMKYTFSQVSNTSNVPLDKFFWHDTLPTDAVRLKTIKTGTWNESLTYNVLYKTNLKSGYKTLASGLTTKQSHTLDCDSKKLGLASNEYITDIRFEFGTVKAGFKEEDSPTFTVNVLSSVAHDYRIVNRTDTGGELDGKKVTAEDTWVTMALGKERGPLPRTGA